MFYLLKSGIKRQNIGDVLLKLSCVESIVLRQKSFEDLANEVYFVKVEMNNGDTYTACFQDLVEAKKIIKELSSDCPSADDILPHLSN